MVVQNLMVGDAEHPCLEARLLGIIPFETLVKRQEDVLRHILSILTLRDETGYEPDHVRRMKLDQLHELFLSLFHSSVCLLPLYSPFLENI